MEKKIKIFKTITVILFIIAISLISFVGIFRSKLSFKENVIPDFKFGMELAGNREFKFTLDPAVQEKNIYIDENGNYKGDVAEQDSSDTSEISLDATVNEDVIAEEEVSKIPYKTESRSIKANEDAVLNKESYEKTKIIIQKRLESAQIPEYNLRLNTITGELILEVPSDDYTEKAYNLASEQGDFKVVDAETGVVLLDNTHLKKVQALYTANDSYQAYLQIEFNNEGAEILKDISKEYVETTDESGNTEQKKVELKLDNATLLSTYFGEELTQGMLQITMGAATTDYKTFNESYSSAKEFADILNYGKTPNKLVLASDNFIKSQITNEMIITAKILFAILIVAISAILVLKYKLDGVFGAISIVGYVALTMLVIRYTNVVITLNSILSIIGITVVNYVFIFNFLNRKKSDSAKHAFLESMKKLSFDIIPLWVIAIIFTFMSHVVISSVGMVLFWGLFILYVYNFCITRALFV